MTGSFMRHRAAALAAAVALVALRVAPAAGDTTWTGGTGDWFDDANWSAGVPTASSVAAVANGGTALIGGGSAAAAQLTLDAGSRLEQSAGAFDVPILQVNSVGGAGSTSGYQLGGDATLSTLYSRIGFTGAGSFEQTGGTHALSGGMALAVNGAGTYTLSGGSLTSAGDVNVGYNSSTGTFNQSGGTVAVGGTLGLAVRPLATAAYNLSAGSLSAPVESVSVGGGKATFSQTGGANSPDVLQIASQGRYSLAAGSLSLRDLVLTGTFDFAGSGTLTYSGILDFSRGKPLNLAQANVTGGAQSLLLVPAGANPATFFGTFQTQGLTHAVGQPLTIPAGRSVVGSGVISDAVTVAGTLGGGGAVLAKDLTVLPGATAAVKSVTVTAASGLSGSGTSLTAAAETINSGGTFTHAGGSNDVGALTVNAAGTYAMSQGTLTTRAALENQGTLNFGGATAGGVSLDVASGIANLATGSLINATVLDVSVQPGALLLLPAGANPSAMFHSVAGAGTVHVTGTPITIPAGTTLVGGGTIQDFVTVNGTLTGTYGTTATLRSGIAVGAGAVAQVGDINVQDANSAVAGGTLSANAVTVGNTAGDAALVLSSGTVSTSSLGVGGGNVTQTGGSFSTGTENIGGSSMSAGHLTITGGSHAVSGFVSVADHGTLTYGGGASYSAGQLSIGPGGTVEFQLDGEDLLKPMSIGSSFTFGGTLAVTITGHLADLDPSDNLVLVDSAAVDQGSFLNVPNGGRLATNGGSFEVNYGATSPFGSDKLVLSDFQPATPAPEPTGAALVAMSCAGALLRRRRRGCAGGRAAG